MPRAHGEFGPAWFRCLYRSEIRSWPVRCSFVVSSGLGRPGPEFLGRAGCVGLACDFSHVDMIGLIRVRVLSDRDRDRANILGVTTIVCRSRIRLGYAACSYSLINPWTAILRRTRTASRLVTGTGTVSRSGGRCLWP